MGDEGSWPREKRPLSRLDDELQERVAEVGRHPGRPANVHRCLSTTAPCQQYRSVNEHAEARSRVTCAECGLAGQLRVSTSGYYLTLCDSHASGWSEPGAHEP